MLSLDNQRLRRPLRRKELSRAHQMACGWLQQNVPIRKAKAKRGRRIPLEEVEVYPYLTSVVLPCFLAQTHVLDRLPTAPFWSFADNWNLKIPTCTCQPPDPRYLVQRTYRGSYYKSTGWDWILNGLRPFVSSHPTILYLWSPLRLREPA